MALRFLVIICLAFHTKTLVDGQGYNGCNNGSWYYHGHSHTCFVYVWKGVIWTQARDDCRSLGMEGDEVKGHLAKIDDVMTNDFIKKALLPKGNFVWIGLYKPETNVLRWDGFPDQVPQYTDPLKTSTVGDFTDIRHDGWQLATSEDIRHYICQRNASIPKSRLTCPPPTREGYNFTTPIECQFYFNHWSSISWYLNTRVHGPYFTCNDLDPSHCTGSAPDGLTISNDSNTGLVTVRYAGLAFRQLDDLLRCAVRADNNKLWTLDTVDCHVHVYEPPSNVTCNFDLDPNELAVTCITDRIYPKAECRWTYSTNSGQFQAVPLSAVVAPSHRNFKADNGLDYVRSECRVTMTQANTQFESGQIRIQVSVFPSESGLNPDSGPEAVKTVMKNWNISFVSPTLQSQAHLTSKGEQAYQESPQSPVIGLSTGQTVERSGPLLLWEGRDTSVTCQFNTGSPEVQTAILLCDFAMAPSGGKRIVKQGTSVIWSARGDKEAMHGKDCSCWGEHITGSSPSLNVTVDIATPVTITRFATNVTDDVEVGGRIAMTCTVEAEPAASISIKKIGSGDGEYLQATPAPQGEVIHEFQVRCWHNGGFTCTAVNGKYGQVQSDSRDLAFRVLCPPTLCDDVKPQVKSDPSRNTTTITLCAYANPVPEVERFELQTQENAKEWTTLANSVIKLGISSDFMNSLEVTVQRPMATIDGRYRLVYTEEGPDASPIHLPFEVAMTTPVGGGDGGVDTGVVVAVVVSVLVVVALVVLITAACIIKRRKRAKGSSPKELSGYEGQQDMTKKKPKLKVAKGTEEKAVDDGNVYVNVENKSHADEATHIPSLQTKTGLNYIEVEIKSHNGLPVVAGDVRDKAMTSSGSGRNVDSLGSPAMGRSDAPSHPTSDVEGDVVYVGLDKTATIKMQDSGREKVVIQSN